MPLKAQTWRDEVIRLDGIILNLEERSRELLKEHTVNCYTLPDTLPRKERTIKINETWSKVCRAEDHLTQMRTRRMQAFMNWAETAWSELS